MTDDRILSAEEVRAIQRWLDYDDLCDSHEALRAENARLREALSEQEHQRTKEDR